MLASPWKLRKCHSFEAAPLTKAHVLGHGSHPTPAPAVVASMSRELGVGIALVRLAALGALESDKRKVAQVRPRLNGARLRVAVAMSDKGGEASLEVASAASAAAAQPAGCGAGCHAARCARATPRRAECRSAHRQGRLGTHTAAAGDRAGARPQSAAGGEPAGAVRAHAARAWRWRGVRRCGGARAAEEYREACGCGGAHSCPYHCARARRGGSSRRGRGGSGGPSGDWRAEARLLLSNCRLPSNETRPRS